MKSTVCALLALVLVFGVMISVGHAQEGQLPRTGAFRGLRGAPIPSATASWTPIELVDSSGATVDPRYPDMVAASDRVHVVWESEGQVRYAYHDGIEWHLDETLDAVGDSPGIALDANGTLHLVYARLSLILEQIQVYHMALTDSGWTLPHLVSGTFGAASDPDISLLADDDIHVVWAGKLDGGDQVFHARSSDLGHSWYFVDAIPGADGYAPSLDMDANGRVWVAWQSAPQTAEPSAVWVSSWDGQGWATPTILSHGREGDARRPRLGCAMNGQVHVAWEHQDAAGTIGIAHAHRSWLADDAWAVTSSPSSSATAMAPYLAVWRSSQLAANGLGSMAFVAWDAGDAIQFSVLKGGTWLEAETLAQSAKARDVAIGVNSAGIVFAVWSAFSHEAGWQLVSSQRTEPLMPAQTSTATPSKAQTLPTDDLMTRTPTPEPKKTATPTYTVQTTATATAGGIVAPTIPVDPTPNWVETWFFPVYQYVTNSTPVSPTPEVTVPAQTSGGQAGARKVLPGVAGVSVEAQPTVPSPWAWGTLETVAQAEDAEDLTMVQAYNGDVHAVWREPTGFGLPLLYHAVRGASGWSAPVGLFVGEEPDLAAGPNGDVYLVYANESGGSHDIFATRWYEGSWSPPQNVSATSGTSAQPAVTVKSDGTPIVVWVDSTEGAPNVYHGWLAYDVWNTFYVPNSLGAGAPDVCVGKSDRVWVGWHVLDDGIASFEIYALFGDGSQWARFASNISEGSEEDSLGPRMAGIGRFGAFMVWREGNGDDSAVYYSDNVAYTDWWEVPTDLTVMHGQMRSPSIATSSSGSVTVGWFVDAALRIRQRTLPTRPWSEAGSAPATNGSHLCLTVDSADDVHCAWIGEGAGGERILYQRASLNHDLPYGLEMPLVLRP